MSEKTEPVDYLDPPFWSPQGWTGPAGLADYERELRRYAEAIKANRVGILKWVADRLEARIAQRRQDWHKAYIVALEETVIMCRAAALRAERGEPLDPTTPVGGLEETTAMVEALGRSE